MSLEPLSPEEQKTLLDLARFTLVKCFENHGVENGVNDAEVSAALADRLTARVRQSAACFVTLKKNGRLRGCIGTLVSDQPLCENVIEYAQSAAFGDPRFDRLRPDELKDVLIDITVLGPLSPLPNLSAVEIGRHGLAVQARGRRAVFLAHVATEQGWDLDQFTEHLCEKAGLDPRGRETYEWQYFEEFSFAEQSR